MDIPDDISALNTRDIRVYCRSHGLETSGTRKDMIRRLEDYLDGKHLTNSVSWNRSNKPLKRKPDIEKLVEEGFERVQKTKDPKRGALIHYFNGLNGKKLKKAMNHAGLQNSGKAREDRILELADYYTAEKQRQPYGMSDWDFFNLPASPLETKQELNLKSTTTTTSALNTNEQSSNGNGDGDSWDNMGLYGNVGESEEERQIQAAIRESMRFLEQELSEKEKQEKESMQNLTNSILSSQVQDEDKDNGTTTTTSNNNDTTMTTQDDNAWVSDSWFSSQPAQDQPLRYSAYDYEEAELENDHSEDHYFFDYGLADDVEKLEDGFTNKSTVISSSLHLDKQAQPEYTRRPQDAESESESESEEEFPSLSTMGMDSDLGMEDLLASSFQSRNHSSDRNSNLPTLSSNSQSWKPLSKKEQRKRAKKEKQREREMAKLEREQEESISESISESIEELSSKEKKKLAKQERQREPELAREAESNAEIEPAYQKRNRSQLSLTRKQRQLEKEAEERRKILMAQIGVGQDDNENGDDDDEWQIVGTKGKTKAKQEYKAKSVEQASHIGQPKINKNKGRIAEMQRPGPGKLQPQLSVDIVYDERVDQLDFQDPLTQFVARFNQLYSGDEEQAESEEKQEEEPELESPESPEPEEPQESQKPEQPSGEMLHKFYRTMQYLHNRNEALQESRLRWQARYAEADALRKEMTDQVKSLEFETKQLMKSNRKNEKRITNLTASLEANRQELSQTLLSKKDLITGQKRQMMEAELKIDQLKQENSRLQHEQMGLEDQLDLLKGTDMDSLSLEQLIELESVHDEQLKSIRSVMMVKLEQEKMRLLTQVQAERDELMEKMTCKVCMDNMIDIVLLPCGHITVCSDCCKRLQDCPICRAKIVRTGPAFLA